MKKMSYICSAYNISPIFYLLAGNDNPYRNIDDCLAMGRARETWRKYTAEMRCVVSNPVREAFVIYSVIMLTTHQINRQQAEAAAAAVRNLFPNLKCVHARTDGWGRCRIWAYCRLGSGVKQSAVARGKGAATALMNFIARINAQPELKKAATAVN